MIVMRTVWRRSVQGLCALLLALLPATARAEVTVTFYSHAFGDHFPHVFITMQGRIDATGATVDDNIGFTARRVSPAVLMGSVEGMMEKKGAKYIADSTPQLRIVLDDAGFARLQAAVTAWAAHPQKSYNLNRRNCIHFIMELARTVGMTVNPATEHIKKPRAFLDELGRLNPATVMAPPPTEKKAAARTR